MNLDTVIARLNLGDGWQIDRFDCEDAPLRWHPLEAWRVTSSTEYWAAERIAWLILTAPGHTHSLLMWPAAQKSGPPAESWLIPSLEDYPDHNGSVLKLPVAEFVPPQWTDTSGAPFGGGHDVRPVESAKDALRGFIQALTSSDENRSAERDLSHSADLLTLSVKLARDHAWQDHGTGDWTVCDGATLAVMLTASAYVAIYAANRGESWIIRPE